MATWAMAAEARTDFSDLIDGLSPEQLEMPSLCDEWTARGVLAHLTSFVEVGLGSMFLHMVKNKFDFDRVSISMAAPQLERSAADVVRDLRTKAAKSAPLPMFPEAMTMTDVAIHTQDLRRPLGLDGTLDPEVLRAALEFLTTHKMAATLIPNRPTLEGVRLVACDLDWSHGSGPEIRGTGEAILMALANRDVVSELTGDGLATWASA